MKLTASLLFSFFFLVFFLFSLAEANPSSSTSSPPHAFSTPEQTWDAFKASILAGDFDMAKKCCCAGKTKWVIKFEQMNDEKRKSLVQSMLSIKKIEQQKNSAKYEVVRDINGVAFSTFVYFEKIADDWKIARY